MMEIIANFLFMVLVLKKYLKKLKKFFLTKELNYSQVILSIAGRIHTGTAAVLGGVPRNLPVSLIVLLILFAKSLRVISALECLSPTGFDFGKLLYPSGLIDVIISPYNHSSSTLVTRD